MNHYQNEDFTGERALFRLKDAQIENCVFHDGESPLKEGRNLTVKNSTFQYKYPLWYGRNHRVENCKFELMSRSGIWYTDDSTFLDCDIIAPKEFRRCHNLKLKNIVFHDASQTLWTCDGISLISAVAKGDYLLKDSKNLIVENLKLDGNYAFDGCENVQIRNSVLNTKDAFWNCKNVTLENCVVKGEYFGWNSSDITLINCEVSSHQGFCYMKNLLMKDCKISDSDLIFEYCENIDCDIHSSLSSVKNPISGVLKANGIETLIFDDERIQRDSISILVKKGDVYEKI